ncbi:MAG: cation:dicarboxylase symporter family transporter [Bacteroidota bacterium]
MELKGIALILGIDRILDMCRTVLNVTGDLVTSTIVYRFEGVRTKRSEMVEV